MQLTDSPMIYNADVVRRALCLWLVQLLIQFILACSYWPYSSQMDIGCIKKKGIFRIILTAQIWNDGNIYHWTIIEIGKYKTLTHLWRSNHQSWTLAPSFGIWDRRSFVSPSLVSGRRLKRRLKERWASVSPPRSRLTPTNQVPSEWSASARCPTGPSWTWSPAETDPHPDNACPAASPGCRFCDLGWSGGETREFQGSRICTKRETFPSLPEVKGENFVFDDDLWPMFFGGLR